MALVVILALIVMLSVILVAFVSQSRVEVSASSSFSNAVVADGLAKDAVNSVIGSLQYEVQAGSKAPATVVNQKTIYEPLSNIDLWPRLDGNAGTTNVPTLLRTSRAGGLYQGSSTQVPASSVTTDQPSLEGRKISLRRWNYPRLLTKAQNETLGLSVPSWIYVNRAGPVSLTAWSDVLSRSLISGAVNPSYIIGRYAYRVYDISGLVDVNVAGYPVINIPAAERIGRKGGLSWANLQDAGFPGWTTTGSNAQDFLLNWRWPAAGYADFVDGEGAASGFLRMPSSVPEANRFLSRSDFLGFLESATSQFPTSDTADFATQGTTFSREVNAPSWKPDSAPTASPVAMNPFVPSVRVGTAFTRRNGQPAEPGEPLVNQRFPLSKIELFKDPDANATAIRKYFGLVSANDGTWIYDDGTNVSGTGFSDGTGQSRERLKTLEEVAAANREPNFFEMLQAAIQADSLGQAARDDNKSGSGNPLGTSGFAHTWADKNLARQVLQIGVNIIDQYDENNDPTVIRRPDTLKWSKTTPDPDIAGVENTPFIQMIAPAVFRDLTAPQGTGTDNLPLFPVTKGYFQFQLWNPHQNASAAESGEYRIVGQGNIKLLVLKGTATSSDFEEAESAERSLEINGNSNNPDRILFNTSTEKFAEPHLLRANEIEAGNSADKYEGVSGYGSANIAGFHAGTVTLPYTRVESEQMPPGTLTSDRFAHDTLYGKGRYAQSDAVTSALAYLGDASETAFFQLQKKVGENWLPIQTVPVTFDGTYLSYNFSETLRVLKLGPGSYKFFTYDDIDPAQEWQRINRNSGSHAYYGSWKRDGVVVPFARRAVVFSDPRTLRFGTRMPSRGDELVNKSLAFDNNDQRFGGWLSTNQGKPVVASASTYQTAPFGNLYDNRAAATFCVRDRGGAAQPFRLGDAGVKNRNSPASPFANVSSRPFILNRPFKSASEMSQASRDIPWRNLNFANDVEAPQSTNPVKPPADSALLDFFTIAETPAYRAGTINLNAASKAAILALLLKSDGDADPEGRLTDTEAETAASAVYQYLGSGKRVKATTDNIIASPADIARMVQSLSGSGQSLDGWAKAKKETLTSALAQAHNGRTWNLLIDVIAQSGKFPAQANSLQRFSVTGEKRLLVHVAIDRYTGQVIDRQVEQVSQD